MNRAKVDCNNQLCKYEKTPTKEKPLTMKILPLVSFVGIMIIFRALSEIQRPTHKNAQANVLVITHLVRVSVAIRVEKDWNVLTDIPDNITNIMAGNCVDSSG